MASTYTHYKFADDVLQALPSTISEIIKRERQLYDIGCHGSDLFFYYNPLSKNEVNSFGHELHDKKAIEFFTHCVRVLGTTYEETTLSYVLGFVTHFALDSCVHGYVERKAQSVTDADFDHGTIEVEFDRYLLVQEGKDPIRSSLIKHIVPSKKNSRIIAKVFPNIGFEKTFTALKSIVMFNNILNAPSKIKRHIVFFLLKVLGKYDSLRSQIISFDGDARCVETNAELQRRYNEAIPIGVGLVTNFFDACTSKKMLSERFNKTFSWEDNE